MTLSSQTVLRFRIDDRHLGLPVEGLGGVFRAVAITPLPRGPKIVEGVINMRGNILPVFDIRRRFGLPVRPVSPDDHMIVATAGARRVVLRADRVVDLVPVDAGALDDGAEVIPEGVDVAGVLRRADGLLLVQDLGAFLSEAEALELDAALAVENGS